MPFRPFRKIPVTDQHLSLLQDNVFDSMASLERNDMLTVHPIYGVSLVTGSNQLSHGLGRAYRSYFVGNYDTSVTVKPLASPDRSKYIVLQASAPVTVDLFMV